MEWLGGLSKTHIAICEEDSSGGSYRAFCCPANIEAL